MSSIVTTFTFTPLTMSPHYIYSGSNFIPYTAKAHSLKLSLFPPTVVAGLGNSNLINVPGSNPVINKLKLHFNQTWKPIVEVDGILNLSSITYHEISCKMVSVWAGVTWVHRETNDFCAETGPEAKEEVLTRGWHSRYYLTNFTLDTRTFWRSIVFLWLSSITYKYLALIFRYNSDCVTSSRHAGYSFQHRTHCYRLNYKRH